MFQIISPFITDQNEEIAIPAIELWITIAEEEKNNFTLNKQTNLSITLHIHTGLLTLLLQNLTKVLKDSVLYKNFKNLKESRRRRGRE
jgi:hypothetical protein